MIIFIKGKNTIQTNLAVCEKMIPSLVKSWINSEW